MTRAGINWFLQGPWHLLRAEGVSKLLRAGEGHRLTQEISELLLHEHHFVEPKSKGKTKSSTLSLTTALAWYSNCVTIIDLHSIDVYMLIFIYSDSRQVNHYLSIWT